MSYTKEKAKRAEFVLREIKDLVKAIAPCVDAVQFIDRGDYEYVRCYDEQGNSMDIDITGCNLAELAMTVIERVSIYEE